MTGIIPLRQSTAFTWKAGPFVDDTDGKTAKTALSIAQADIRLTKNGGDYAQSHNAAGATHDEYGSYDVPLDTTDTNTLGHLRGMIQKPGALPVWQDFWVKPANVFDADQGTDLLDVNVSQISEDTDAANNLEAACDGNTYNVGGGAVVAASVTGAVVLPTGTGAGQISLSSGKVTVGTNDDKTGYTATVSDKTGFSLSTAGILAIWHQLLSAIETSGSVGKLIKDYLDAKVSEVGGGTPPTVEQIRAEMDANSTKLAHLDTDISSRLAAEDYTEPPSEDDIAARITEDHGPGAYGSGVGLQLKEYTLTQEGTPVAGVACWVTSDAAGLIRISPVRQTNSLGKVVFQLDVPVGTTVYIWYQGATTGDAEVV